MSSPMKFQEPQAVVVRGEGGRFEKVPSLGAPEIQRMSVEQGRDMNQIAQEPDARVVDHSPTLPPYPKPKSTDDGAMPWAGMTSGR